MTQTWEITDLDGSNKRRITLEQYLAEVKAAAAKARAIHEANKREVRR